MIEPPLGPLSGLRLRYNNRFQLDFRWRGQMIKSYQEGEQQVIQLCHGKASALDLEFAREIAIQFEQAAHNPEVNSLVLTGTGKIFSAGVDLFRLVKEGPSYAEAFLEALGQCFRSIFSIPKPVVAAINGHAMAGGVVMAMACDERVLIKGPIQWGVPEIPVGVGFPPLAFEILQGKISPTILDALCLRGESVDGDQVEAWSLIQERVEADQLLPSALKRAQSLAQQPDAFRLYKHQRTSPRVRAAEADTEGIRRTHQLWTSRETHLKIADYLEKNLSRRPQI